MGRVGATLGFFQSLTLIVTIFTGGFMSDMLGVKNIVIGSSLFTIIVAVNLNVLMYASHQSYSMNPKQKELARN